MKILNFSLSSLLVFFVIYQTKAQDFQYKNVILGIVISPHLSPVPNTKQLIGELKELIKSSITTSVLINEYEQNIFNNNTTNNNNNDNDVHENNDDFLSTDQNYNLNNNYNNNGGYLNASTRVSNITTLEFDLSTDLSTLPDLMFVFSFLDCDDSHELNQKMFEHFGPVVHFALTNPGCTRLDDKTSFTIPLSWFTPTDSLYQLLVDARQKKLLPGWKNAVIICDKQTGTEVLNAVIKGIGEILNYADLTRSIFNIDSMSRKTSIDAQMNAIFELYKKDSHVNFVILTMGRNVGVCIDAAKRSDMLKFGVQFLFITSDGAYSVRGWTDVVRRIVDEGVNIALVSNHTTLGSEHTKTLLCQTEAIMNVFSDVVENITQVEFNMFLQVSDEEWEMIKPTRLERTIEMKKLTQSRLQGGILDVCSKSSNLWKLEALENGRLGKRVLNVGTWTPLTGLILQDDLFPHVTGGFRGRAIDITSMHYPPWMIFHTTPDAPNNITYKGLIFEIVNHMADTLNFTYNVIVPRDVAWGLRQADGSWNGMTGLVKEGQVVLGAAAFTVTAERSSVVNFTSVLDREGYTFIVNRPQELSRIMLFAEPFTYDTWIAFILAVIAMSPVLHMVHRNSAYYEFYGINTKYGLFQMKNCFWYLFSAILQQGGNHLPLATSGRVLIGFWWLLVLVAITSYSGSLVAFLTFPKIELPVNGLEDILNFRGVDSWGIIKGSIVEGYLRVTNNPKIQELYEKAVAHDALDETVLERVRDHNHALIDWKIALQTLMADQVKLTGRCDFALGEEEFFEEEVALIVPRYSPYLHLFDNEIKIMLESGLIKKWKAKYWPGRDKCTIVNKLVARSVKKVGIIDMQGSFYLLLVGFTIAAGILFVEYMLDRKKKQKMVDTIKTLVSSNKDTPFWKKATELQGNLPTTFLH